MPVDLAAVADLLEQGQVLPAVGVWTAPWGPLTGAAVARPTQMLPAPGPAVLVVITTGFLSTDVACIDVVNDAFDKHGRHHVDFPAEAVLLVQFASYDTLLWAIRAHARSAGVFGAPRVVESVGRSPERCPGSAVRGSRWSRFGAPWPQVSPEVGLVATRRWRPLSSGPRQPRLRTGAEHGAAATAGSSVQLVDEARALFNRIPTGPELRPVVPPEKKAMSGGGRSGWKRREQPALLGRPKHQCRVRRRVQVKPPEDFHYLKMRSV